MKKPDVKTPPINNDDGNVSITPTKWPVTWERPRRFSFDEPSTLPEKGPTADYMASANLFRRSYIRTIGASAGQPVDAKMVWFVGNNYAYFKLSTKCHSENLRTLEDYEADKIEGLVIDFILSGTDIGRDVDSGSFSFKPGELLLTQTDIKVLSTSNNAEVSSLFIQRSRLVAEAGSDFAGSAFHIRRLSDAALAPLAGVLMRELYSLYGKIPPSDFEVAVEAAISVLMKILREELTKTSEDSRLPAPLKAAMEFINEHYRDPQLSPESVASALNASRTKLYRLFADRGLSVATYIRDIRLQNFVAVLRETPDAGIGRLAWRCGFDMGAPEFSKLFKKSYGMTPGEAKQALNNGKQLKAVGEKAGSVPRS